MSNPLIVCLFCILGLITGFLVTILGKINDLAFKLEYTRSCVRESINKIEDLKAVVTEQNDFYLDIMKRSLESDEKFGNGISETLSSMVENIRDRDKKIADVIKTMHANMESIKDYVAEFVNTEDDRLTMIADYIREATINNSPPDEGG